MSTTSTASTASTTDITQLPVAQLPQIGSSFGALKFNLNKMLGWMLGNPFADEILLYSDFINPGSGIDYYSDFTTPTVKAFVQYNSTYPDQTLQNLVSTYETYNATMTVTTMSPDDYKTEFASKDGLFGFSWFPWNVGLAIERQQWKLWCKNVH